MMIWKKSMLVFSAAAIFALGGCGTMSHSGKNMKDTMKQGDMKKSNGKMKDKNRKKKDGMKSKKDMGNNN